MKFNKLERILFVAGLLTLILTAAGVIYSLGFLSNNLLRALHPDSNAGASSVEFDIKGFQSLRL